MSETAAAPRARLTDVCCASRGCAIDDVTLDIEAGRVTALVAAPKPPARMLLDCLAGLAKPTEGEVLVLGKRPEAWGPEDRRRMVYVRGPARFPFAVRVRDLLGQQALLMDDPTGCDRVLEEFGLTGLAGRDLFRLDAESQHMVRVAGSLIGDPDILLYESLFQNLSPSRARLVAGRLRTLAKAGKAILYIADDMQIAEQFCDRVLVLGDGRVLAFSAPDELQESRRDLTFVEAVTQPKLDTDRALQLPFVIEAGAHGRAMHFTLEGETSRIYELLDYFRSEGVEITGLRARRFSLQDAVTDLLTSGGRVEISE